MDRHPKRAVVAGALILAVGLLLLVSILLPWYEIGLTGSQSGGVTLSPDGQVTVTFQSSTASTSFSTAHLNATGQLYTGVAALLVLGGIFGLLGGSLGIASGWRPNYRRGATVLGILGLVFAILAPVVLLIAQPAAINSDGLYGRNSGGISTPASTFFGSASGNGGTETWGPSVGWYLGFVAGALSLVGTILLLRNRPEEAPSDSEGGYATLGEGETPAGGFNVGSTSEMEAGAPGYVCTRCALRFDSVQEFQRHVEVTHNPDAQRT
ncbi:MAG: hypothetical protein L3K07_08205 [Thermoplasmata archaeon]|nr:hypothetical protein [Thermoplasmata archaeon]